MSTKAIREALKRLRELERLGVEEFARIDAAEVEVEAIEKAAKAFHEDLDPRVMSHAPESLHDALDVLTDITKEAP